LFHGTKINERETKIQIGLFDRFKALTPRDAYQLIHHRPNPIDAFVTYAGFFAVYQID
jgi:hypothetical protein